MKSQTILRAMYKSQIAEHRDILDRAEHLTVRGTYFEGAGGIAVADDRFAKSYQRHNRQWWRFYTYLDKLLYQHDSISEWNENMRRKIQDGEVTHG